MPSLEAVPGAALLVDPEGRVLAANRRAGDLLGSDPITLSGLTMQELLGVGPSRLSGDEPLRIGIHRGDGVPVSVDITLGPEGDERVLIVRELVGTELVREARSVLDLAFDHTPICAALFNTDRRVHPRQRQPVPSARAHGRRAARPPRPGVHPRRGPRLGRRRGLADPPRRARSVAVGEALRTPRRHRRVGDRQHDVPARRGRAPDLLGRAVPGHHRAPFDGGAPAPDGRRRRAHRAAEPPLPRPRARARRPARPRRAAADRPRRLQGGQRLARPRRGRRRPDAGRRAPARAPARAPTCSPGSAATSSP